MLHIKSLDVFLYLRPHTEMSKKQKSSTTGMCKLIMMPHIQSNLAIYTGALFTVMVFPVQTKFEYYNKGNCKRGLISQLSQLFRKLIKLSCNLFPLFNFVDSWKEKKKAKVLMRKMIRNPNKATLDLVKNSSGMTP